MVTIAGDTNPHRLVTKANDAPEGPLFSFKSEVTSSGTTRTATRTVNVVSSEEVSRQFRQGARAEADAEPQTLFGMLHPAG